MKWVRYVDVMELLQAAREGPCDVREIIWGLRNLEFIITDDNIAPSEIKVVELNSYIEEVE